jgi:predicted CXXCH cytochrome family protein
MLLACGSPDETPERADSAGSAAPAAALHEPFAEAGSCAGCHPQQAEHWAGSHHDLAMQPATQETVLGDFDDASFAQFPVMTRFFRRDGRFFVNTQGPDGENADFEVLYTFGVEPLQQYLVELPGGRLQAFPIAWDTERGRWFDVNPEERAEPGDPFHWTGRYQSWNAMCAECHSTGLAKGYDVESDTYQTTWAGIDVGCQACHGPGAEHVALAQAGTELPTDSGLAARFSMSEAADEIAVCAPCHSRRHPVTRATAPGHPLLDHFVPRTLLPGLYHADGQIREEVYVYGSFLQSRMHQQGVRCSDCHDPHGLTLVAEGDALCTQCHSDQANPRFPTLTAKRYDSPEHHFHPPDSIGARCVECHMPATTYMQVEPRRDHSLRVPRPDLSLAVGTPNACSGCHADRDAAWAADHVRRRHGSNHPPHFALAFSAASAGVRDAGPALVEIAGDERHPAIVRATALDLLRSYGPETLAAALEGIGDPDPLVRMIAVASFERLPPEARLQLAAPLLDDPVRAVRVEAGRVLASVPRERLSREQRRSLDKALREFDEAQQAQADLPSAHLNLGVVASARGHADRAEAAYRRALAMDPGFLPARANLVHLYNETGRPEQAERLLREGIEQTPDEGELYYSLGLLLAEQERLTESAEALSQAAQRMPERSRVHYNLGLALQRLGRSSEAEAALLEAQRLDAGDPSIPRALAVLSLQQGDRESARSHAEMALRIAPNDRAAADLLRRIDRESAGR